MSMRKTDVIENFGERLASLRKAAGYTQVEFDAEVGITQRTVAYYEAPGAQPPAHLLQQMAQVLGVPSGRSPNCWTRSSSARSSSSALTRRHARSATPPRREPEDDDDSDRVARGHGARGA